MSVIVTVVEPSVVAIGLDKFVDVFRKGVMSYNILAFKIYTWSCVAIAILSSPSLIGLHDKICLGLPVTVAIVLVSSL